jgi:hypothetical protein
MPVTAVVSLHFLGSIWLDTYKQTFMWMGASTSAPALTTNMPHPAVLRPQKPTSAGSSEAAAEPRAAGGRGAAAASGAAASTATGGGGGEPPGGCGGAQEDRRERVGGKRRGDAAGARACDGEPRCHTPPPGAAIQGASAGRTVRRLRCLGKGDCLLDTLIIGQMPL